MPPLQQLSPQQQLLSHKLLARRMPSSSRTSRRPPSPPESMLPAKTTIGGGGVLKLAHHRRFNTSPSRSSNQNSTTPPPSPSSSSLRLMRRPPKPSSSGSSAPNSPRRSIDSSHDKQGGNDEYDDDDSSSSRSERPVARSRTLSWSPTTNDDDINNHNQSTRQPSPPAGDNDESLAVAEQALQGAMRRYGSDAALNADGVERRPGSLLDARVAPHVLHLGNLHFRRGHYDDARDWYQRALWQCQPGPHVGDACANLGTVLWTTGDVEPALQLLHLALDEYQRQDNEEDGSADASSDASVASSTRTATAPTSSSERVERVANVYHQLGLAHCLNGDCKSAVPCLNQALQLRESLSSSSSSSSSSSRAPSNFSSSATPSPALAQTRDALAKVLTCQNLWDAAAAQHELALGHWRAAIRAGSVPRSRALPTLRSLTDVLCKLAGRSSTDEPQQQPSSGHNNDNDLRGAWIGLAECYERLGRGGAARACRREAANVP